MEPDAAEEGEGKLSVWVCREEKLVSGVSKRTTCADVVRVLLQDQNTTQQQQQHQQHQQQRGVSMLSGSPQSYCVVEKWRGFERILPNKTKILRLWSAWGDEQENVRFVLVKNDASLPNTGPRSAEARVVQSKEGGSGGGGGTTGPRTPLHQAGAAGGGLLKPGANLSQQQDKQRRVVRKAFRKLDKMNKVRRGGDETAANTSTTTAVLSKDRVCMEKMETLVHLVISQDHTIRQQVHRLKEVDREIERYEATVHFDRIKRHGVNYVQDTYMTVETNTHDTHTFADCKRRATPTPTSISSTSTTSSISISTSTSTSITTAEALAQFEEYARRCEEMVRLEEELTERQALVESVTAQLEEELNQRWMKRRREVSASASAGRGEDITTTTTTTTTQFPMDGDVENLSENELALEEERIKTQLDTSLYIGLRLNTDLEAMKGDLNLSRETWEAKERELLDLLAKVETLEGDAAGSTVVVVLLEAQVSSSSSPSPSPSPSPAHGFL
ncbi:hypothetical protein CRUP_032308 [Coryphaenoides rupestris]|nr:hypothetical protein CRUP_032308 [Coryphaenoides rupestris]